MNELTKALRAALGDTFLYAFKAHSYHWNVRGFNFTELHAFFGAIYADADGAVDPLAEYIRIEGELSPKSIAEMYAFASINEDEFIPGTSREMIENLIRDNAVVMASLTTLFHAASAADAQGIADFVSARLDAHKKFQWMLKSHVVN